MPAVALMHVGLEISSRSSSGLRVAAASSALPPPLRRKAGEYLVRKKGEAREELERRGFRQNPFRRSPTHTPQTTQPSTKGLSLSLFLSSTPFYAHTPSSLPHLHAFLDRRRVQTPAPLRALCFRFSSAFTVFPLSPGSGNEAERANWSGDG